MIEKVYSTPCGVIHYWVSDNTDNNDISLVFLPGLTADHRLFNKQIEYFEGNIMFWYGMRLVMRLPGRFN